MYLLCGILHIRSTAEPRETKIEWWVGKCSGDVLNTCAPSMVLPTIFYVCFHIQLLASATFYCVKFSSLVPCFSLTNRSDPTNRTRIHDVRQTTVTVTMNDSAMDLMRLQCDVCILYMYLVVVCASMAPQIEPIEKPTSIPLTHSYTDLNFVLAPFYQFAVHFVVSTH